MHTYTPSIGKLRQEDDHECLASQPGLPLAWRLSLNTKQECALMRQLVLGWFGYWGSSLGPQECWARAPWLHIEPRPQSASILAQTSLLLWVSKQQQLEGEMANGSFALLVFYIKTKTEWICICFSSLFKNSSHICTANGTVITIFVCLLVCFLRQGLTMQSWLS